MSFNKKPNLGLLLALGLIGALTEESNKKEPKSFEDFMSEFDDLLKTPKKTESKGNGTLFEEILNEISDNKLTNEEEEIHNSLKNAYDNEINYIGIPLNTFSVIEGKPVSFYNSDLTINPKVSNILKGKTFYHAKVHGGFCLAYMDGNIYYVCKASDGNFILFKNKDEFYNGNGTVSGLRQKIKEDILNNKI